MSIRQLVADATFLSEAGRHQAALTMLLLAVAASARKCFPAGSKSLKNPAKDMGDGEAFTLFLGGRIRKLLFSAYGAPEYGPSLIAVSFKGRDYDIVDILYKFYRCELVHQGDLPDDVEFVPLDRSANRFVNTGSVAVNVSINPGNKMVLDHGWLGLLSAAVVQARCNGAEFGIQHVDLVPKAGVDVTEFERSTVAKYAITVSRLHIVKQAVQLISPDAVLSSNDGQLSARFSELVRSGQLNGGAISGLSSRGLTDHAGRLQAKGIAVLREIALTHVLIPA